MKINRYPLLLIALAALLLNACRKDGSKPRQSSIVGQWQQLKLTLHQNTSPTASHDTTFSSASFMAGDYFSFSADGSAVRSQTGAYGFGGKVQTINGGTFLTSLNHYTYTVTDTTLALTSTDRFPTALIAGPSIVMESIKQLDATHLILQQKTYFFESNSAPVLSYDPTLVTTSYYTRR